MEAEGIHRALWTQEDVAAIKREHPRFHHGLVVKGPSLTFREAGPGDASFILDLRLDDSLNRHLSLVDDDLEKQADYIMRATRDPEQVYFIIEHDGRPVGTVRLYDRRGMSFGWGSWILKDAPPGSARQSMKMVYAIGRDFRFRASHFDVRKDNEKVWRFHESYGAKRAREDDSNYYYSIGLHEAPDCPIEVIW